MADRATPRDREGLTDTVEENANEVQTLLWPSGAKRSIQHFHNGRKTGLWVDWYPSGRVHRRISYREDRELWRVEYPIEPIAPLEE